MSQSEVFDEIAPGWYGYRHHTIFPEELRDLAVRWCSGKLLNAGCGHGADFLPFKERFELYGLDFSQEMLMLARKYADKYDFPPHLVRGDIRTLPYADGSFDNAIAVASYHHIKKPADRLIALCELRRVLKPGGEVFLTLWNHWQPRFWMGRSDRMVPWYTKGNTYYRYYHLFSYREAEILARKAGFEVVRSFPEHSFNFPLKFFSRNICLLLKKQDREHM
jgi:tRNA (uracil-5-)-methyltransferase TRM9